MGKANKSTRNNNQFGWSSWRWKWENVKLVWVFRNAVVKVAGSSHFTMAMAIDACINQTAALLYLAHFYDDHYAIYVENSTHTQLKQMRTQLPESNSLHFDSHTMLIAGHYEWYHTCERKTHTSNSICMLAMAVLLRPLQSLVAN